MFTKEDIQIYTAFKSFDHLYVKGRVYKARGVKVSDKQGPIKALFNTLLRAFSAEMPDFALTVIVGEHVYKLITDDEGYFEIFQPCEHVLDNDEILIKASFKGDDVEMQIPLDRYEEKENVGIISDIDDTVMVSGVKSFFKLRLLINTAFLNPFRRKPIENAAQAYKKLVRSIDGYGPIIYLSNSPWNIYDYLQAFLDHNEFPEGILMLRDMGWQLLRHREIEEYNKYIEIERMLIAFEKTSFYLIGDTGEKDFDIYRAIAKKHPERIKEIIMVKAGNAEKEAEIQSVIDSKEFGIRMIEQWEKQKEDELNEPKA